MNPFWILLLLFPALASAAERVRHVECRADQIVTVRTAMGIATIIQVPDRPNSVVVGDQDKFKVEYLDQAITIKPVQPGAKSNLYVYTDYQRFNVQLITGPEAAADYVVYLDNIKARVKEAAPSMRWTPLVRIFKNENLTFETKRLGHTRDGVLLIEFKLSSIAKDRIRPEWFWITQDAVTRPIQNLFLANLELNPGDSIQGVIQILRKDIDETKPLRIELRRKKTSFLTIPKVNTWK